MQADLMRSNAVIAPAVVIGAACHRRRSQRLSESKTRFAQSHQVQAHQVQADDLGKQSLKRSVSPQFDMAQRGIKEGGPAQKVNRHNRLQLFFYSSNNLPYRKLTLRRKWLGASQSSHV